MLICFRGWKFWREAKPCWIEDSDLKKITTLKAWRLGLSDPVLGDHQRQIRQEFERIGFEIYTITLRI